MAKTKESSKILENLRHKEQKDGADMALVFGILTFGLVLISSLVPVLWTWIYCFFFIPFVGIAYGIKAIKIKEKRTRAKAACGILLCVLPFLALIPFQIKEDDYITAYEFDTMEDFQFYSLEIDDDDNEYYQLKHRLLVYEDKDGYVPHRDGCKTPDCYAFIVKTDNSLLTSLTLANDVTIKTRSGNKILLENTSTKKCFVFGLYCPKYNSDIIDGGVYDTTRHTTLYIPETTQVKVYLNMCTNEDKNEYGRIREDKKECAMNENNYTFKSAYDYYRK